MLDMAWIGFDSKKQKISFSILISVEDHLFFGTTDLSSLANRLDCVVKSKDHQRKKGGRSDNWSRSLEATQND